MTKEMYQKQRKELLDAANQLLDEGKVEEANARMDEVKDLDARWEVVKEARANMKALEDAQPALPVDGAPVVNLPYRTAPIAVLTREDAAKSQDYVNAWAKTLMGKPLTQEESKVFALVNEYTHTTENTGVVIPDTVAQGIWSEIEDMYPYYADVAKTYVKGTLTMVRATATTDAAWYDEDTATEDGTETLDSYTLTGCELARAITVSWKLKEMAMEDFIPYIQRRMAERMGAALGYGVTNGAGKPGTGDTFKPEPLGVCTALVADGNQVVSYSDLTYADITKARGLVKSGYANGLKIYANGATIWNVLANVVDANGRPIFINDQTSGGVYRVLGTPVVEDASLEDGQILFSNAARGYQVNINKQITMATEDHTKARTTDYCGYAIVDGAPLTYKAHALLQKEAA